MAAQFLVALKAVPWSDLLKNAPLILRAADALWSTVKGKKEQQPAGTDVQVLKDRIAALEEHDQANAELIKQMAQQIQSLTDTAQVLAARLRIAIIAGCGLLIVSIALAVAALSK